MICNPGNANTNRWQHKQDSRQQLPTLSDVFQPKQSAPFGSRAARGGGECQNAESTTFPSNTTSTCTGTAIASSSSSTLG